MPKHLILAALAGLIATPAVAPPLVGQQRGTWEIGGFGRYNDYHKSYEVSRQSANGYGVGGRLGFFFSRNLAIEADGSGNWTDVKEFFTGFGSTALSYYPFHLRVVYNKRFGEDGPVSWLLGAGPGYNRYGKNVPGEPSFRGEGFGTDWAMSGITGIRVHLLRWLALRVDGTLDYISSPNNGDPDLVSQFAGITATTPATQNINLGAQAGLSLMLGMCNKSADGTTISPTTASIRTSETASFSATATRCGKPDQVVFSVSGPGSADANGRYTSTIAGRATVTGCGRKNRICATANVTVTLPPPPITVTACELSPATASARIDRQITYTVTRVYSDGRREPVSTFTLSSPGGAVSGASVSWSTPGTKSVTVTAADCPAVAAATVEVAQPIMITVRDSASAFFQFDKTVVYRTLDQQHLTELARTLQEHPEIKLVIDGHADADGTVKYNEGLGMRRATSAKDYLAAHGAPIAQMTIVLRTFGECQPAEPNRTAVGRAANRRAEIREFGNTPPGEASAMCREAGRERTP